MGCCESCFNCDENKQYQDNVVNEHTRLLNDPVSEGSSQRQIANYNGLTNSIQATYKSDEHSALNDILQKIANDVIDVSATDTHTLEQQEYDERLSEYSNKLRACVLQMNCVISEKSFPIGVASPYSVLSAAPVPISDIQLVSNAAEMAHKAMSEVKVKHKEDLVVPFGVP